MAVVWAELGPTITSKMPGSTTLCMSVLSMESVSRRDDEVDGLLLTWFQSDALESFQLQHGASYRGNALVYVHLRDFVTFAGAGVGYIDADFGGAARADLIGLHAKIFELKVV